MEEAYAKSKTQEFSAEDWQTKEWEEIKKDDRKVNIFTGVPKSRLLEVGE